MKSTEFLEREARNVKSLLEMLEHAIGRLDIGKDVPGYMLKEIIELLQIYIHGSHKMREDMILTSFHKDSRDVPTTGYREIHTSLRKYERFLFKVIDAYDLGYDGARKVFARYAGQYLSALRQYIGLEKELLIMLIGDREERDKEILKQFKKIRGRVKTKNERGLVRVQALRSVLGTVTAGKSA